MTIDISGITAVTTSHALASGLFERVNAHEPKSKPGNGLTCAVWANHLGPVPAASGLRATTARLEMMVRLYTSMLAEPQDAIDPAVISATDLLFTAYSGDFDFGGQVRDVDLLGAHGTPLSAQAGYLNIDGKLYRVMTITLPLIINDAWEQVP